MRRFADRLSSSGLGRQHAVSGLAAVRAVGEGTLVCGALGAAHAMLPLGLDIDGKVPLDGVIALVGLLGGVGMAHEEFGQDLTNIGAAASNIFAFRKVYAFAAAKKMNDTTKAQDQRIPGDRMQEQNVMLKASNATAAKVAGEFGFGADMGKEDPIVLAARCL